MRQPRRPTGGSRCEGITFRKGPTKLWSASMMVIEFLLGRIPFVIQTNPSKFWWLALKHKLHVPVRWRFFEINILSWWLDHAVFPKFFRPFIFLLSLFPVVIEATMYIILQVGCRPRGGGWVDGGGRIRTCDLQVETTWRWSLRHHVKENTR